MFFISSCFVHYIMIFYNMQWNSYGIWLLNFVFRGCSTMKKIPWDLIRILCFLLFFGLFYLIPVQAVESGSICLLYRMTGYLCPGCGVTRGFVNFLHLNFSKAFSYNPVFTCSLFPIGILLAVQDITVVLWRTIFKKPERSMLEYAWDLLMGRWENMLTALCIISCLAAFGWFAFLYAAKRSSRSGKRILLILIAISFLLLVLWGVLRNFDLPFWVGPSGITRWENKRI